MMAWIDDPWFKKMEWRPKSDQERLTYLVEECGESLAAAGKALRFGLESYNPDLSCPQETNAQWLARELKDLKVAIKLLERYTLNEH